MELIQNFNVHKKKTVLAANSVLAGRDLTAGREGGTWLAIDAGGRMGMLTNVFTGLSPDKDAKGRGFLIHDYLAGGQSAQEYLEKLSQSTEPYSPFNLVLLEPQFGQDGSIETYRQSTCCFLADFSAVVDGKHFQTCKI